MIGASRRWRGALVALALAALGVRAWRWLGAPTVSRYVVDGPSMEPAFRAGDRVLVNRMAYRTRPPRIGEVVVLRDPERDGHVLLKRVANAPSGADGASNGVYVLGDNAEQSRDSRAFGAVDREQVLGKAWMKY